MSAKKIKQDPISGRTYFTFEIEKLKKADEADDLFPRRREKRLFSLVKTHTQYEIRQILEDELKSRVKKLMQLFGKAVQLEAEFYIKANREFDYEKAEAYALDSLSELMEQELQRTLDLGTERAREAGLIIATSGMQWNSKVRKDFLSKYGVKDFDTRKEHSKNGLLNFIRKMKIVAVGVTKAAKETISFVSKASKALVESLIKKKPKNIDEEINKEAENLSVLSVTQGINEGILEGNKQDADCEAYLFVAVLDERTTDYCRARDGLCFSANDSYAATVMTPPIHYNCRSMLEPISAREWNQISDEQKRAFKNIIQKVPLFIWKKGGIPGVRC